MSSVYISDLDGTLLRNDATLSEFAEETLRDLITEGLLFTVASARSVVSMQGMLRGLPLPLPVIEFNGAFLSDLATGRHEMINAIEPPIAKSLYELVLEHHLVPFVSSFNGSEDRVHYDAVINEGMHWYLSDRLRHGDCRWRDPSDLAASLREQVVCFTVVAKEEALVELETAVVQRHAGAVETHLFENQYSPGWHWLTIHDYRATKDQAIRLLTDRYGLSGREVVAFGDQNNDLKMFQIADRAVAVANATEELKHRANIMIGSNEEDSVVKFIAEDWVKQNAASDLYIPEGV